MGAKNSENSTTVFLSMKAKTSDTDPTPYIGVNVKEDGQWKIGSKFNAVDGVLHSIKCSEYEYENEVKNKCEITLLDDDGTRCVLSSNFNNLLYSVLNSLASDYVPGKIEINVWLGKENDQGKRYPSAGVKIDGEKLEWKYKPSELPKPKVVPVPGTRKTVTDDTNVIEFWKKVIDDISSRLSPPQEGPKSSKQSSVPAQEQAEMPNDDLPF